MAIFIIDLVGDDEDGFLVVTTSKTPEPEKKVVDRASIPMPHLEIVPVERECFRKPKPRRPLTN